MLPKRIEQITPFMVMEILEKAHEMERQGIDVIHLEVGEPDFDAPECVKKALFQAIQTNKTHYTHSLGILELRQAICEDYYKKYHVVIDPDQVVVTSGTSPALFLIFSVLLDKGDQVIVTDPHYACYSNYIHFMEATPVKIPVVEEDGFQYRLEDVKQKINASTQAIVINSPCNPTGTILSPERMKAIAECSPYIISDEIYHGLVYEGNAHSILEYTDHCFVINGFSKLYAMTGLRIGYLIAPKAFIRPIQKLQQNFFISANSAVQYAAITALKEAEPDVIRMKQIYNERRKMMIAGLKELGFRINVEPTGAFYVFVNARHLGENSYQLAFDILNKAHVGVAPGIDFGQHGEGYLRFCYANSIENIQKGMLRLHEYIQGLQQ
ncbi:MAG: pyridoxal phosphate-dependent aminotransferase [Desulfobacterales bacterium]|nr:pyridoxal phosphate-dependent aminotransferase [Desulfobacterales bacterium]